MIEKSNMRIVKIAPCIIEENFSIQDGKEVEEIVLDQSKAWKCAQKFISEHSKESNSVLDGFWGTWEGQRVLFLGNDNAMALQLKPNRQATLAYLAQSIPGTQCVVLGPVVALMHKLLW